MADRALIIAAHPDDEVFGCGGTIAKLTGQGVEVHLAFLADGSAPEGPGNHRSTTHIDQRRSAARGRRHPRRHLGHFDDLPDNRLDSLPLLDITQRVEALIEQYQPATVFTHHAGDLNIDHQRVHQAVITACRPQRGHPVRTLLCFEVPSSTEWQPPGSGTPFAPNWFVDISATLEQKLAALDAYATELRAWPHPRSRQGVEYLARWRGATIGCETAEAFMLARHLA